MEDSAASLAVAGEMEDINLPLDEIIQRKAQQERDTSTRQSRRGQGRRFPYSTVQRPFPRSGAPQDISGPRVGTGVFHGEAQLRANWQPFEEAMPYSPTYGPNMDFDPAANAAQYWQQQQHQEQMYMPPPPPPDMYRSRHFMVEHGDRQQQQQRQPLSGGLIQGGIRKPVLDRRRGRGRGRGRGRRQMHPQGASVPETPEYVEAPDKKEDKCTMTIEKGEATIQFKDIKILKVNTDGDLKLTTEGHQDGQFFKALNEVLGLINMGILGEEGNPQTWNVKDGYALHRYFDGIAIKGKGEPTKNRAETIKKAFEQPNPKALEATLASNLAARRLGLAFDSAAPGLGRGPPHLPPRGSIRITQDQQLTRTSNYSISFVDQTDEHQEGVNAEFNASSFPHGTDATQQHASGSPGYHSYQCGEHM